MTEAEVNKEINEVVTEEAPKAGEVLAAPVAEVPAELNKEIIKDDENNIEEAPKVIEEDKTEIKLEEVNQPKEEVEKPAVQPIEDNKPVEEPIKEEDKMPIKDTINTIEKSIKEETKEPTEELVKEESKEFDKKADELCENNEGKTLVVEKASKDENKTENTERNDLKAQSETVATTADLPKDYTGDSMPKKSLLHSAPKITENNKEAMGHQKCCIIL